MNMKPIPCLLPMLALLAGTASAQQTPGSAPHTYSDCTRLKLTDAACHQQIVEAGGTVESSPDDARDVEPLNFQGWDEKERWYRDYVHYAKRGHRTIRPVDEAYEYYPGFPPEIKLPYFLIYP